MEKNVFDIFSFIVVLNFYMNLNASCTIVLPIWETYSILRIKIMDCHVYYDPWYWNLYYRMHNEPCAR